MDRIPCEKLDYIDSLVMKDPVYHEMLLQCGVLEKQFDTMVKTLPEEHRALAWDFVMLCEDMSRRALEIACENLDLKRV